MLVPRDNSPTAPVVSGHVTDPPCHEDEAMNHFDPTTTAAPVDATVPARIVRPSMRRKIILFGRVSVIAVTTVMLPYSIGGHGKLVGFDTAWAENADDDSDGIPDGTDTDDNVTDVPDDLQSADNSDDTSDGGSSSEGDSSAGGTHDNDDDGSDDSSDGSEDSSDDGDGEDGGDHGSGQSGSGEHSGGGEGSDGGDD